MDIFLTSNICFRYNEKGNSKLKTSYDVSVLQNIFGNIVNHVEKNIKEIIGKKNYGDGMNDMTIVIYCHSKEMLKDIKEQIGEEKFNRDFGEEFKQRGKLGESSVRIDAENFLNGDFLERVELMFGGIKKSVVEFKKIMDSRKVKKEFDIKEFFKDLDIAKENTLKVAKE
ncbi:hypothetical protein EOM39_07350 [Candidatus Gracilibacteria bacterium]|nr:hypothetical protein [Candidatus Gracilibacteria bacterium]